MASEERCCARKSADGDHRRDGHGGRRGREPGKRGAGGAADGGATCRAGAGTARRADRTRERKPAEREQQRRHCTTARADLRAVRAASFAQLQVASQRLAPKRATAQRLCNFSAWLRS
jgi:hypothetical protein